MRITQTPLEDDYHMAKLREKNTYDHTIMLNMCVWRLRKEPRNVVTGQKEDEGNSLCMSNA